jgi:hypothetical protein
VSRPALPEYKVPRSTANRRATLPTGVGAFGPVDAPWQSAKVAPTRQGGTCKAMDSPATYFHWGFILISMPNLLVIAGMVVLFAIALVAPFPHRKEGDDGRNK